MDERERRVEIQLLRDYIHDFGGKRSIEEIPTPASAPFLCCPSDFYSVCCLFGVKRREMQGP